MRVVGLAALAVCAGLWAGEAGAAVTSGVLDFDNQIVGLDGKFAVTTLGSTVLLDPSLMGGAASGNVGLTDRIFFSSYTPGDDNIQTPPLSVYSFDIRPVGDGQGDFDLTFATLMGGNVFHIAGIKYGQWTHVTGPFITGHWTDVGVNYKAGQLSTLKYGGDTNLGQFYVDNVAFSGAPEPATWAMAIAGFGMTGVALRRLKSHAHAKA